MSGTKFQEVKVVDLKHREVLQTIRDDSRRKILATTSEDWKDAWKGLAQAADRLDAMMARTRLCENRTTGD